MQEQGEIKKWLIMNHLLSIAFVRRYLAKILSQFLEISKCRIIVRRFFKLNLKALSTENGKLSRVCYKAGEKIWKTRKADFIRFGTIWNCAVTTKIIRSTRHTAARESEFVPSGEMIFLRLNRGRWKTVITTRKIKWRGKFPDAWQNRHVKRLFAVKLSLDKFWRKPPSRGRK